MAPALPIRRWVERRRVILAAAAVLFAAVFVLRQSTTGGSDAIAVLYVVPIALVALELGIVAGLASVALAVGLVAIWSVTESAHVGATGYVTGGIAFLAVGAVAGRFGDRMREVHKRQFLLLDSGLRLAHLEGGAELAATLARQAHELVPSSWARAELSDGPAAEAGAPKGHGVTGRIPIEVRDAHYGTLTLESSRPIGDEDRATLEMLALQAAVAAENRRLLASERERAAIHQELQAARVHLEERRGQMRELIDRHEAERYQLAHELNEQAAQSLAAVLLGIAALERELGSRVDAPRLGGLRMDVDSTLQSLRSLAVSLRPPALELGLQTALERLSDAARRRGFGEINVSVEETGSLSPDVETMAYRVVEEALESVGAARTVSVHTRRGGSELEVHVDGAQREIAHQRLAVLRARMELVGGTLSAGPTELRAVIPLRIEERSEEAANGGFAAAEIAQDDQ